MKYKKLKFSREKQKKLEEEKTVSSVIFFEIGEKIEF